MNANTQKSIRQGADAPRSAHGKRKPCRPYGRPLGWPLAQGGARTLSRVLAMVLALTLTAATVFAGTSCSRGVPPSTAEAILAAMLAAAPGHPAGWAYARTADPSGVNYLPGGEDSSVEELSGDVSPGGVSDAGQRQRVFYLTDTLFAALYGPSGRGWLGTDGEETSSSPGYPSGNQPSASSASASASASALSSEEPALIQDGAIFLSTVMHPFELGVFRCADLDGALSVAALCQARLDSLRTTWQGSPYAVCLERAVVTVDGCYVLFLISDDPDPLLEAARQAMR